MKLRGCFETSNIEVKKCSEARVGISDWHKFRYDIADIIFFRY